MLHARVAGSSLFSNSGHVKTLCTCRYNSEHFNALTACLKTNSFANRAFQLSGGFFGKPRTEIVENKKIAEMVQKSAVELVALEEAFKDGKVSKTVQREVHSY